MLERRRSREYQLVHDRRIVKRKRAGKDPVADDSVRLHCVGKRDHRHSKHPSQPTADALVIRPKTTRQFLLRSPGGACQLIMREHKTLMPPLSENARTAVTGRCAIVQ